MTKKKKKVNAVPIMSLTVVAVQKKKPNGKKKRLPKKR
jgi:hypothetical protein